jgi:hypothetical protein
MEFPYKLLIILSGQGIDVILGMTWMNLHNVMLDVATHLVHLNSPMYGKVTLHLLGISRIRASLHHIVEKRQEEIPIVREFRDIFPDGLP